MRRVLPWAAIGAIPSALVALFLAWGCNKSNDAAPVTNGAPPVNDAAVAPSDGATGGGADTVTLLVETRSLTTLQPAEATQLCFDASHFAAAHLSQSEQQRLSCALELTGLTARDTASARALCAQTFAECLAHFSLTTDAGPPQSPECSTAPARFATCTGGTVADYSACMREGVSELKAAAAVDPCADITTPPDGGAFRFAPASNASPHGCDALHHACGAL